MLSFEWKTGIHNILLVDLNTDCLLNFRPQTRQKRFHWLNRQKVQMLDPTIEVSQRRERALGSLVLRHVRGFSHGPEAITNTFTSPSFVSPQGEAQGNSTWTGEERQNSQFHTYNHGI